MSTLLPPTRRALNGGASHHHDMTDDEFVTTESEWIDRRALERLGWIIEDPDGYRGEPFERAIHPSMKNSLKSGSAYPCWVKYGGPVVQIVYAPVGESRGTWANSSWEARYPRLYKWFMDDADLRSVRCHGVVFVKSDF